jgi:predicted O-methyltransferase YrrM
MSTNVQRKLFELILGFRLGHLSDAAYRRRWMNGHRWLGAHEKDSFVQDFDDMKFFQDLTLKTAVSIKFREKTPDFHYAMVLFSVARDYMRKNSGPFALLETGTAKGFSALLLSRASILEDKQATVYTLDIIPHDLPRFWNVFGDRALGKRTRAELLIDFSQEAARIRFLAGDTRETVSQVNAPRIHIGFLDAMHEYIPLKREFDFLSKRQESGDLVVFDDVVAGKFPGVHRLVEEVEREGIYSIQRVTSALGNTVAIATRQ